MNENVATVNLPSTDLQNTNVPNGTLVTISGWGTTSVSKTSHLLKQTIVWWQSRLRIFAGPTLYSRADHSRTFFAKLKRRLSMTRCATKGTAPLSSMSLWSAPEILSMEEKTLARVTPAARSSLVKALMPFRYNLSNRVFLIVNYVFLFSPLFILFSRSFVTTVGHRFMVNHFCAFT